METGIDGIFYAVQHAQAGILSLDEYRLFGLPNDRLVIEPAASLWCNLLHLHGLGIYFDLVSDLSPVFSIVNWHDRETPPTLREAQTPGVSYAVCGGISQHTIVYAESTQVRKEAEDAIRQTRGRRFILGTGCVVPVIAPHGNLRAAVDAARGAKMSRK
jgi:uroporphyrinogen decarboxylase